MKIECAECGELCKDKDMYGIPWESISGCGIERLCEECYRKKRED